jgi:inner membrane protein YhjD
VSAARRLDAFQQRHRWMGFPLAVAYKFADDQGPYLAALITYYGFLSLFPLLLLLASVLGFVLQRDPDLQRRILDSTLSQFPVIGDQLGDPQGLQGSNVALVVGAVVAVYGALGVALALQNAMNVAWAVPRWQRPNPLRARLRSLVLIATGGVAVLATTILSALGGSADAFGAELGQSSAILLILVAGAVNVAVFILAFRICTIQPTTARDLVPGAITAAIVWQLLQLFGTAYVGNVVKGAGATYGVFALVLGLLAWIFLAAVGVVLSGEINVVRARRLYPRSLLTPFTDDVDLTDADRRVYRDAAAAQQAKGFESVTVSFDDDGQHASAKRRERDQSLRSRR